MLHNGRALPLPGVVDFPTVKLKDRNLHDMLTVTIPAYPLPSF
jgi:hypothetical protein